MRIFKETTGQGREVVLLHGWGVDHRYVAPLVRALSPHCLVTTLDLPGSGQSEWSFPFETIDEMADLILPHLPEKAIYIGWSIGGQLAISIAARYPKRATQLIGLATTPKFMEAINWPGMPKPGFAALIKPNRDRKAILREAFEEEFAIFHSKPPLYHELLHLLEIDQFDYDIFAKGLKLLDKTDLRKEFQTIQCPIDLILGKRDGCIPAEELEAIKKLNSKTKIHVIPKGGHLLFWSQPDEVNLLLSHLLAVYRSTS